MSKMSTKPDQDSTSLGSWHFDVFAHKSDRLVPLVVDMFNQLGLLAHFSIAESVLFAFLYKLEHIYQDKNPFHNFVHAFDVTQAAFCMLVQFNVRRFLSPLDQLALMLAAIGHDAAHVGFTNAYLIATSHPLALLYNDISVLENHHAATTFRIMSEANDCDVLQTLCADDRRVVRKQMIAAILATDMANHQQWAERISTRYARARDKGDAFESDIVLPALLKLCDITNMFRSKALAEKWMTRITDEYFAQGDEMRRRDMSSIPEMFNRASSRPRQQITVGFVNAVVQPYFEQCIVPLLSSADADYLRTLLNDNTVALLSTANRV